MLYKIALTEEEKKKKKSDAIAKGSLALGTAGIVSHPFLKRFAKKQGVIKEKAESIKGRLRKKYGLRTNGSPNFGNEIKNVVNTVTKKEKPKAYDPRIQKLYNKAMKASRRAGRLGLGAKILTKAAPIAGAAALGYGAYKLFKNRKKKKDGNGSGQRDNGQVAAMYYMNNRLNQMQMQNYYRNRMR